MRKAAIFTEGQGELIFIRQLLFQIIGYEHLSFECLGLRSDRFFNVPYKYGSPDNAKVHVMIVNVGNDEKVLSVIAEKETRLVKQGYDKIIGLRDMYSRNTENAPIRLIRRLSRLLFKPMTQQSSV